jgi:hypothetical protein
MSLRIIGMAPRMSLSLINRTMHTSYIYCEDVTSISTHNYCILITTSCKRYTSSPATSLADKFATIEEISSMEMV